MQDERFGRAIRTLRRRRGLRQADVAADAGVPQATVSLVERGRVGRLQVATIRAIARAVEAEWDPAVRWRGGELDRLLDEAHANLVGAAAARLTALGWEAHAEVTYAVYGERGSVDLLGWHPAARVVLVVEVKSALVSVEETLRRHDAKMRLAPRIAAERFGEADVKAGCLLVLPETTTARRHVARHDAVLRSAYPLRGLALRGWLCGPHGPAAGLVFLPVIAPGDAKGGVTTPRRVRRTGPASRRAHRSPAIARDDG